VNAVTFGNERTLSEEQFLKAHAPLMCPTEHYTDALVEAIYKYIQIVI
jgi:hypothetical protein